MCPWCVVGAAAWALYELGSAAYDIYNAGKTLLNRNASRAEKSLAVGFAALSVVGPGGGYSAAGKAAEKAVTGRLIRDATERPGKWRTVGAFTEDAINKKAKGGTSIQTILENAEGDRLVRHTVLDKNGAIIDDHFRSMYKPRDVDGW